MTIASVQLGRTGEIKSSIFILKNLPSQYTRLRVHKTPKSLDICGVAKHEGRFFSATKRKIHQALII